METIRDPEATNPRRYYDQYDNVSSFQIKEPQA